MILTELKIHHLRNLLNRQFTLHEKFNVLIGPNGSGKTSVLEAVYLLSCGRSFRSREIIPMITQGQQTVTVFARTQEEQTISIQKSYTAPTQIKIDNQFCFSTSQLAYALPTQIVYSDIFQIIDAGSALRRSVLDWGMFHVKHEYLGLWKTYRKILKQRNALLKSQATYQEFVPWDNQLSQLADQLHDLRQDYFKQWQHAFTKVLGELTDITCSISYFKGWDKKNTGKDLKTVLAETFHSDKQKLYTQQGCHQADIIIESKDTKAKLILSRGQQKILLIALKLSQANLLSKQSLFLIDDFPSELDEKHQQKLINYLTHRSGQYLLTCTELSAALSSLDAKDSASIYLASDEQ